MIFYSIFDIICLFVNSEFFSYILLVFYFLVFCSIPCLIRSFFRGA